jgi:hypothetical protein
LCFRVSAFFSAADFDGSAFGWSADVSTAAGRSTNFGASPVGIAVALGASTAVGVSTALDVSAVWDGSGGRRLIVRCLRQAARHPGLRRCGQRNHGCDQDEFTHVKSPLDG